MKGDVAVHPISGRISRVFKNVVRGFSLVHDPKGSHYENPGGEGY